MMPDPDGGCPGHARPEILTTRHNAPSGGVIHGITHLLERTFTEWVRISQKTVGDGVERGQLIIKES